jgi:tetratricopeptide (TPR) repeat protein
MIYPKTSGLAARRSLTVLALAAAALFYLAAHHAYQRLNAAAAQQPSPKRSPQQELLYHNNIAIALLEQFNFREALGELAQCLKIEPKFVPALVNSGLAHFYLQEFPQAEVFFKKAVALNPSQPSALFALGMIYRNQNQMDAALESFSKILATDAQDSPTLYQAGQIYLKQQKYEQAVNTLRKVIELSPYDIAAHYNLATALIRKGDQAAGQKMMETFTRLREKGGISSTGTQYGEQGQYMLAIGEYPDIKGLSPASSAAPARPVKFVDATEAAGIRFQHGASIGPKSPLRPMTEQELVSSQGSGAAFWDYDNDGHLDIYLGNSSGAGAASQGVLLHSDGKGHFNDVTEKSGIQAAGQTMGAYWGDFNNDGKVDLFLTQYGTNRLYQNNGDGTFADVSAKAGFASDGHWHLSAAVADVDHDGDLDVYVGNYVDPKQALRPNSAGLAWPDLSQAPGGGCHLYRNNADGTFTDIAEAAGVKVPNQIVTSAVFTDFDNRRDIDFWVVSPNHTNHLYSNQRVGTFQDLAGKVSPLSDLKGIVSASVGDYDKDGWMDFALVSNIGESVLVTNLGASRFRAEAPLSPPIHMRDAPWGGMSQFIDYDNDGDLDLFVLRGGRDSATSSEIGPEFWENQQGKLVYASEKVGLAAFRGKPYRSATFGDYDNDGDTDILMTVNGGKPVLLRNDGGNQNNWIKIRLQGTNSNKSGIGTKVEVKSGALWQKVEINGGSGYLSQSPPEVIFGLGQLKSVDALRLLWPGGVLQSEINLPVNQTKLVQELDRKGTSCPLLYTWNGEKYEFVTDFLGGCAIGYLLAPGEYNTPDTDEYVRVTDAQLKLKDGRYSLRMNNQLEEVLFIDQTELVAVDHPAGVELFPNERLMPGPPFPEFKLFAAQNARPPKKAWDHQGHDVLPLLTKIDRNTPRDFKLLPYKGYAEEHSLTLELGDVASRPQIQLLMTAWIDYADSTANFKASQTGTKLTPPYLQTKNRQGRWETVLPRMGFPAGLPKTMVVDLTGKLPPGSSEIRIVTSMRIYWDQILVNTFPGAADHKLHRLTPLSADLRYAGFPREYSPDGKRPLIYDYDWIDPVAPWKSHAGDYTRFGDVTSLLGAKDDQYVIMRNGDEIQIDFTATSLPPLPADWRRTFLFYADGFGKDMDLHSAASDTVTPLPFHRMSKYPYPETEKYPDTDLHRRYRREYNTRRVPEVLSELRKH